jgi:hypothetical protein
VYLGCYVYFADFGLWDAFLVASHRGDDAESSGVDFGSTIAYDADCQPSLPYVLLLSRLHRWARFLITPCMDRVKSSSVVSGHDDVDLAEGETVVLEIVGSAGCGRVAHVSEFALSAV